MKCDTFKALDSHCFEADIVLMPGDICIKNAVWVK